MLSTEDRVGFVGTVNYPGDNAAAYEPLLLVHRLIKCAAITNWNSFDTCPLLCGAMGENGHLTVDVHGTTNHAQWKNQNRD